MKKNLFFVSTFLFSCATFKASKTEPRVYHSPPIWEDFDRTLEIVRCAVVKIDGEAFAEELLDVRFVSVENFYLNGCYDPDKNANDGCFGPKEFPPPTIYINAKYRSALESAMRYEILCRRRSHLKEKDPRKCTAKRWENEIKPLYNSAISKCHRKETKEVDFIHFVRNLHQVF